MLYGLYRWFPGVVQVVPWCSKVVPRCCTGCTGGSLVLYRWFPGAVRWFPGVVRVVQVVPWCCTGGSLVQ